MICSLHYIDIGNGVTSSIIASTIENECFEKVTLETCNFINNKDKVFSAYGIPSSEIIIAYCKSGIFGLTTSGIVFTDKAIYAKFSSSSITCTPYINLCKYIPTREYDKANGGYLADHSGVFLRNKDENIRIYDSTLISKNIAAEEIMKLLDAIYKELCSKNTTAKNEVISTINDIHESYRDKMRHGIVTSSDNVMLRYLLSRPECFENTAFLLAEYRFRHIDEKGYDQLLSKIADSNPSVSQKLSNPYQIFSNGFISDLSNVKFDISTEFLETVYNRLRRKKDNFNKTEAIIYILVLIRIHLFGVAEIELRKAINKYGYDEFIFVENYILVSGALQMQKIYDDIKNEQDVPYEQLILKDGLGLTPLHYAILFCSDEYIEKLFEDRNWSIDRPNSRSKEITNIYDYVVLAAIKDRDDIESIICNTNYEIKKLMDSVKQIQEQDDEAVDAIREVSACINDAKYRYSQMKEDNASFAELNEIAYHIENMENARDKANDTLSTGIGIESNLNDEIFNKSCDISDNLDKRLNKLYASESPLVKLLISIYQNSEDINLDRISNGLRDNQMRIYKYKDFCFLLPDDIILDIPYRNVRILESGEIVSSPMNGTDTTETSKPFRYYSNSWFSPIAHKDLSALSSEYRHLVKRYHPDMCKESFAHEIFIEISSEYQELSESLK